MKTVKIDGIDWPDIRNGKDELIAGWFDFFILYDEMIQKFDNAQFLEIGTWKGRSTVYMAEKIRESGKNIKLTAIDIFGEFVSSGKAQDSTDIYEEFLYNIKPYQDIVTPIKGDSRVIHKDFRMRVLISSLLMEVMTMRLSLRIYVDGSQSSKRAACLVVMILTGRE
jgi:hypothetical protein